MKTIYILIITSCFMLVPLRAQNETDALRYSQNFFGGTARSTAMGGAFGALGGDFASAAAQKTEEVQCVLDQGRCAILGNSKRLGEV